VFLTVRQAMEIGPLQRSKIISGQGGMDNTIKSVTVMDVPDIQNWLKGSELVLTNVFAIRDDLNAQKKLITVLKAKNVAALGIKLRRFIETVPEEMLQLSNKLDIPIIELPADVSWIDIIDPVLQHIVNEHYKAMQEAMEIHNAFMKIILEGGGLGTLCDKITGLIGAPVAVVDLQFNFLATSQDTIWNEVGSMLSLELNSGISHKKLPVQSNMDFYCPNISKLNKTGYRVVVTTMKHENILHGYMLILLQHNANLLQEHEIMTLERASIIAELEIVKDRDIQRVTRKFINEFLAELIEGKLASDEIRQRAHFLGIRLYQDYAVVLIHLSIFKKYYEQHSNRNKLKTTISKDSMIRSLINRFSILKTSLCYERGDLLAFFVPRVEEVETSLTSLVQDMSRLLTGLTKGNDAIKIGVGGWKGIEEIGESYREAEYALKISMDRSGRDIYFFDDLGLLKIFLKNSGDLDVKHINEIYGKSILPLIDYDGKNHTDLFNTLDTYFKQNLSLAKTSKELFIHSNTLRYRLERIEALTRLSLKNSDDCFNLYLGLNIHNYLIPGVKSS
jgi:purine catabolism regulator